MIIETKQMGFVQIEEENIIQFPRGIYGFEEFHRFVLLQNNQKPSNPFLFMQCVDHKEPCFVVVDPHSVFMDYHPVISEEVRESISLEKQEDMRFLSIATVPANVRDLYINLQCPILINSKINAAVQIILDEGNYPMRYYLLREMEG